MGADNQQERLDSWIAGFVDGEGCFHVAINRQPKMTLGWQVLPEFRVVQHKKDTQTLRMIQKRVGCGIITVNHDDRNELRVRGINNLMKIVGFFRINKLKTSKLNNFKKFATVIKMMKEGKHLKRTGLKEIAEIAATMNKKIKSKYLESSETIR